jgi:hypothetical protein
MSIFGRIDVNNIIFETFRFTTKVLFVIICLFLFCGCNKKTSGTPPVMVKTSVNGQNNEPIQSVNLQESEPKNLKAKLDPEVREIVTLIQKMPDWCSFSDSAEYPKERKEIGKSARQIASHELDKIRTAMEFYRKNGYEAEETGCMEVDGKLLVLDKYLFNMPKTIRRENINFYAIRSGWIGQPISGEQGNPKDSDELEARWPWTENEKGEWQLTGCYAGFMGQEPDPMGAFDGFRELYGKRDIPDL